MNDSPEEGQSQEYISTPERKKEYIKRWLLDNPLPDACSTVDSNESTPNIPCTSSNQSQKQLFTRTPPRSPALSEKRLASSPVFGGLRRSLKRMRVATKIAKLVEEKPSCSKAILKEKYTEKDSARDNDNDSHFLDRTKILEFQEAFNISQTSDDNKPNNAKHIDPHLTQFIESVSSDNNTENTEIRVQDAASDTDKTASDLIEEISSQFIFESPQKQKQVYTSQKISTPSSTSSEETNDPIHITEPNTKDTTDPQCSEILTPADQIDSVSTLESKGESSKISYILHYTSEKPLKKRNPKKGSLSELLHTTMAKERSSVNLLRHQLYRNPLTVTDMPFILLQTLCYLSNFNGNQFFQCILIEDTANQLSNLVKLKTDIITVMNVPELSGTINVNQKPVLKVYAPWNVVDPKQLLLHVTRFIAMPSSKENFDFSNVDNKVLKLVEEFHCSCIDKNSISNECNSKFCDSAKSSVKIICNYVP